MVRKYRVGNDEAVKPLAIFPPSTAPVRPRWTIDWPAFVEQCCENA